MAKIAGSPISLNKESVNKVMHELYYPEVKKIDSHYVNLFWRYAQTFWVMFEHLLVVISFMIILLLLGSEQSLKWLVYYFLIVLTATLVQFSFVTAPKSTDQVKQIPQGAISRYFRTEFNN